MASVIEKVKDVFTTVSHKTPEVTHRQKILLAITSAAPQMPDHRSGFFFGELLHPYEVFTAKGWDVDIVSETGTAQPDEFSLDKMAAAGDKKKWEDKQHPIHAKLAQIRPASQVNPAQYNAVYMAGGHACCEDFPTASGLQKVIAQIYEAGGVVGADCHGPAIFQNLKLSNGRYLLEGKEATGFSTKAEESSGALDWMKQHKYHTMQEIVTMTGGRWSEHSSNPMAEYTRVCDRVVTGMNPASAKAVAENMLQFMPAEKEFEPVKQGTTLESSSTLGGDKTRTATLESEERAKDKTFQGERTTV